MAGGIISWLEGIPCTDDINTRNECSYDVVVECKDGVYYVKEDCFQNPDHSTCWNGLGCVSCTPDSTYCKDNDVYTCTSDGMSETLVKSCGDLTCQDGDCPEENNCALDAQFIYLVDDSYNLIKFNPGSPTEDYLSILFSLRNCHTSATPFSMAVDRDANAWVLYQDSTLVKVNIATQACTYVTQFNANGSGLSLFGMAFSLDAIGAKTDTLFIGDQATYGNFGKIDTAAMTYTRLATFPNYYEKTPELTGTGHAKLYAFAPGIYTQHISEIDKATGNVITDYQVPGAGNSINAWAFAHWGGYYFMFETVGSNNKILRFDPNTQQTDTFMEYTPYRVVGAGVSTCAPTVPVIIN
ncbi:MAG: hypothetical protein IJ165_09850 [Proteobacteria bacterium]|nr:hypothetical protein [Pseudomonadota bacterium]